MTDAIPFGPPPPAIPTNEDDNPVKFIAVNKNAFNFNAGDGDTISAAPQGKAQIQNLTQDQVMSLLQSDIGKTAQMFGIGLNSTPEAVGKQIQDQIDNIDPTNPIIPIIMDLIVTTTTMLREGNAVQALGSTGAAKLAADSITSNVSSNSDADFALGSSSSGTDSTESTDGVGTGSTDETESLLGTTKTSASFLGTTGTSSSSAVVVASNAFFNPSPMVGFYIALGELARELMKQKEVENNVSQITQGLLWGMTQDTVSAIYAEHNAQAQAYIVSAICEGVSAAISIGTAAATAVMGAKMRAEEDTMATNWRGKPIYEKEADGSVKLDQNNKPIQKTAWTEGEAKAYNMRRQYGWFGTMFWQGVGSAGTSATKMIDNIYQAVTQGKIGTAQAQKETLQSERQLLQSALDKYNQNFDSTTKQIEDLWSTYTNLSNSIAQAVDKMFAR